MAFPLLLLQRYTLPGFANVMRARFMRACHLPALAAKSTTAFWGVDDPLVMLLWGVEDGQKN